MCIAMELLLTTIMIAVMMKMVVMAMGDGGWMVVSFRW